MLKRVLAGLTNRFNKYLKIYYNCLLNDQSFENSHDHIYISENIFSHTFLDITSGGFGVQLSEEAVGSLLDVSLGSTSRSHTN